MCIHGDVKSYPSAKINLQIDGYASQVVTGVAEKLPYPVVVGKDWEHFGRVLKVQVKDVELRKEEECSADIGRLFPFKDPDLFSTRARVHKSKTQRKLEKREWADIQDVEHKCPVQQVIAGEDMGQQAGDPGDPIPELGTSPRDVRQAQKNDPTLSGAYDSLAVANGHVLDALKHSQFPHFMLRDELLYRVCKHPNTGDLCEQILVPKGYRRQLLQLSHSIPLAGHLGREKTLAHLLYRFFWPGVYKEVENFCKSCPECQLVAPKGQVKAPLIPIPLVELPFERIGVDLVGPLEKTAAGNHHILVIVDYATLYPEAIPLRNTSASTIANELIKLFSRVGIPKEILTDQGTNFTSKLMKEVCALLNIKSLKTS
uniref:Gypsy retrotransposon integrase-like protein 1 n=1 Tax=Leptobrachium leishanense TaxID=445787 RepID=A0A8C5LU21_9ANUR